MAVFNLQLISNEQTFKYSFSEEFLNKNYEIGLVRLDSNLEIKQQMS